MKVGDIVLHKTNPSVKWVINLIRDSFGNGLLYKCRCVKYNNDVIEYEFFGYELIILHESENKSSEFTALDHYGDNHE